jgi:hypothetical protein
MRVLLIASKKVPIALSVLGLALAAGSPALAATHRVQHKTVHHAVRHSVKMSGSTANCPNMGSSSTSPASYA